MLQKQFHRATSKMKSFAKIYCNGRCTMHRFGASFVKRHLGSASVTALSSVNKKASYVHVTDTRLILSATIGQLVDLAPQRFGDRLAVIDWPQGIRKTHVQLHEDINKVATGLLALNLKRGDRIAIWSPNRYEWIVTHLAACKAGYILVTINPAFQPKEVAYCLEKVGIRAVVFPESFKTQKYYEMMQKVVPEITESKAGQIKSKIYPNLDTLIVLSENDLPGTFKFKDVMNAGGSREKKQLEKLQTEIQFDDVVKILFTSGTTGKPKAVALSHIQTNNSALITARRIGFLDEPPITCVNVPFFHTFGAVGISNDLVVSGVCAVLPTPGFSPEHSLQAIEREKCTTIYGTPTMYIDMLNHPNFSKTDFSSVKNGVIAGALCPPELIRKIMAKFHCPGLVNAYGSTEASPLISVHDNIKDDVNTKTTNIGKPVPHTELKIVDQNDKIVPRGTPGEICSRGFHIMQGYWEDEEKTREVIKNGWYHTGDIGILTDDDYLVAIGRIKDMIIRGGENIYSKEIEDHLICHPKISDAYVIGVPDKRLGEELCVWIKLKLNETATENEVRDFCKGQISHFKIPKYIRFVDSFPLTTSGKVQKYKMQEEMIKILGLEEKK